MSLVVTSAIRESPRVSKGLLEPGRCVADIEKDSQDWVGEAMRNAVSARERRGGDSQGVSSHPPLPPPKNPVVAGRGREEADILEEEVGIASEVHPSHPHEAMPIGLSW